MAQQSIASVVARDGYVFLPAFCRHESSEVAISRFGIIEQVAQYENVHALVPRDENDAAKNTYSGNFGYGEFPLHTDFAHWFVPPHYLVLRCVVAADQVATRVGDTRPMIRKHGENAVSRALVHARTPIYGQRPLLRLYDPQHGLFRWDQLFLTPASPHGATLFERINADLTKFDPTNVVLGRPGDTLVIDNWRCLHGRSAVPQKQHSREIHRAYLSMLLK